MNIPIITISIDLLFLGLFVGTSLTGRSHRVWFVFGLSFAVAFVEPSPTDVLLPLMVLYVILTRRVSVRFTSFLPLLFTIPLILTAVSTPNSFSLNYTLITAHLVVLCVVATTLRQQERKQVFSGLVWAALMNALVLIVTLILRLIGSEAAALFSQWAGFRGLYKDRNVLVSLLLASFGITVLDRKWIKAILIGPVLIATGSRGGYIGAIITIFLALLILLKDRGISPALAFWGLLLASLCVFPFWSQLILWKVSKPVQSYDTQRIHGYCEAVRWGLSNPQGKYPLQQAPIRVPKSSLKVAGVKGGSEPAVKGEVSFRFIPHNLFFETLAFHGVIGIVVLFTLLAAAGVNLLCNLPYSTKALILLVAVLVPAMFQPPLHWRTLWLALGIALSDFGGRKPRGTPEDSGSE